MKTSSQPTTLLVTEVPELDASNAAGFRDAVRAALTPAHVLLDVDLSRTTFLDSSGLGALIGLHKTMCARQGHVRIVNPTPTVQQILELTRLHQVLEIVKA
jgi:anti-sigma B factor antagonist